MYKINDSYNAHDLIYPKQFTSWNLSMNRINCKPDVIIILRCIRVKTVI